MASRVKRGKHSRFCRAEYNGARQVLIILFLLFAPILVRGDFSVVINEVAWMGTTTSANDEWIELANDTDNPTNIEGWVLKTADEKLMINLKNIIPARGFYLLERTDDTTVPDIAADLIYKGALSNAGENLKLYDNLNNLIDEVDCSTKWFAGDNTTKQTIEKSPTGWQTSENPGGTPKTQNSARVAPQNPLPLVAEQVAPTPTTQNAPEVGPPLIYPDGIVFNEILPSPEGPDETEEWIEVYNNNNFEVNLGGWKIQDTEGKTTAYAFPDGIKIKPNSYLVLARPLTKITLNNTGDKLTFHQPDGEIADTVLYSKSPRNQSYNRVNNGWQWSSVLTPGLTNVIKNETIEKTRNNDEKTKGNVLEDKQTIAALNQSIKQPRNFLSILLTALAVTLVLTAVFFFSKTKIKK